MCTELIVKRLCIVSHYVKSTAFCGAFWAECAYNDVATALYRADQVLNIRDALFGSGQRWKTARSCQTS